MDNSSKLSELIAALQDTDETGDSRATSPGPGPGPGPGAETVVTMEDKMEVTRNRPRTFPYARYLPYDTESQADRQKNLDEILKYLYVSVEAGDFAVGATHWTRELRNWLSLKFDLTKDQRVKLVKVYYELALAPGPDITAADRFASTFNVLLKYVFNPFITTYSD